MTNDNYEAAWSLLKGRYHNKRIFVKTLIQAILDIKCPDKGSAANLRHIYNIITNKLAALKNLGQPVDEWGTLLETIIVNKLDSETKQEWEVCVVKKENQMASEDCDFDISEVPLPTLQTFINFLNEQCRLLEAKEAKGSQSKEKDIKHARFTSTHTGITVQTSNRNCQICNENHTLFFCKAFEALPIKQRHSKARQLNLCLNCLRQGHETIQCKSSFTCKECVTGH